MEAEGILFVVKYLRTLKKGLDNQLSRQEHQQLLCRHLPNYCGLVLVSPHLTVLAFSSHRISSSTSNRMRRGDTACQGDPKNTTGKTVWLEITKVEIIYILKQDHFSELLLFKTITTEKTHKDSAKLKQTVKNSRQLHSYHHC